MAETTVSVRRCRGVAAQICILVLGLIIAMQVGVRGDAPETSIVWDAEFQRWGASGPYLYGASLRPLVLEIWGWDGATLKRRALAQRTACALFDTGWN